MENGRRQREARQTLVESRTKRLHHHNSKDCDSKYAGYPRHCVVDSRSRADPVLADGVHHDGGEGGYRDRHSESENNNCREERFPVTVSDRRQREQHETQGGDDRATDERTSGAITGDKSARPAREKEDKQNQRKDGSAGRGGGVSLDLDKIQGEQKKENSDRGIQRQSKQVCATEAAGFEQRERKHRCSDVSLEKHEGNKTSEADEQTPVNQGISPTEVDRFDQPVNQTS